MRKQTITSAATSIIQMSGTAVKPVLVSYFDIWFLSNILLWGWPIPISGLNSLRVSAAISILLFFLLLPSFVKKASKKFILITGTCFLLIVCSLMIASQGVCTDGLQKGIGSAVVIMLMIFTGILYGVKSSIQTIPKIEALAKLSITITIIFCVIEALIPIPFNTFKSQILGGGIDSGPLAFFREYRYSGIFAEPSHLSITIMPLFGILWTSTKKSVRIKGWVFFVILFLMSRNSTMVALFFAWYLFLIITSKRISNMIIALFSVFTFLAIGSFFRDTKFVNAILDRISSLWEGKTQMNLSSAVYLQGWEDAISNFQRTNGLGLGFNMMGCSPLPIVPIRVYLKMFGMENLNAIDGSFLASKAISEFGVFGALAITSTLIFAVILAISTSRRRGMDGSFQKQIAAVNFLVVLSFFIRSTIYFQGTIIIYSFLLPFCIKMFLSEAKPKCTSATSPSASTANTGSTG